MPHSDETRRVDLFVYGTLKRGAENHVQLAGQKYVGDARTVPGFTLYALDGYPGMIVDPSDRVGVTGEIWSVDRIGLARLDAFEGVAEGLYRRIRIPLQPPHASAHIEAYLYAQSVSGRLRLGPTWPTTPPPR